MIHRGQHSVAVTRCPKCNLVHLIIEENHRIIASVPLTRAEWAQLLGAYGDMLAGPDYLSNERTS